jgi:hypothetical protein
MPTTPLSSVPTVTLPMVANNSNSMVTTGAIDLLANTIFDAGDWVWRPDHAGVLCLERPGIPEADRWWVRCSFDDLPEPPPGFCWGGSEKLMH